MADKRRNALASPEMRETPVRNRLAQYAGNALSAVDEFARKPFGYDNPPVAMLSDALGVPAVASTLNRLAYGDRLTQGKGQTLQVRPEVLEAALAVAPVAAKFPRATAGAAMGLMGAADTGAGRAMFIGANAKTWDAAAAAKAAQMEAAGKDARTIWKETGTFRGADGKLRQEIDDSATKFVGNGNLERVTDAMPHPQLQSSYPDLSEVGVTWDQLRPEGGSLQRGLGMELISANGPGRDRARSVTLHELQHAIQGREGFAAGGNSDAIELAYNNARARLNYLESDPDYLAADKKLSDLWDKVFSGAGMSEDEALKLEQQIIAQHPAMQEARRQIDIMKANPAAKFGDSFDAYKRLAGEAEARATQARMNMDAKQRRAVFPYDSYDVPVNSLIVR